MEEVFGLEAKGEHFLPSNGMLMYVLAENLFDRGCFILIPNCDILTKVDLQEFQEVNSPRDSVIHVLDFNSLDMVKSIDGISPKRWCDLHSQKMHFLIDHRPRSRYLYFQCVTTILKNAWRNSTQEDVLKCQLELPSWGSPGQYIARHKLRGFADEIGYEYTEIGETVKAEPGGIKPGEIERDPTLLFTICNGPREMALRNVYVLRRWRTTML